MINYALFIRWGIVIRILILTMIICLGLYTVHLNLFTFIRIIGPQTFTTQLMKAIYFWAIIVSMVILLLQSIKINTTHCMISSNKDKCIQTSEFFTILLLSAHLSIFFLILLKFLYIPIFTGYIIVKFQLY